MIIVATQRRARCSSPDALLAMTCCSESSLRAFAAYAVDISTDACVPTETVQTLGNLIVKVG